MANLPVQRDRANARVAGVCAALARSWGVDPVLVRAGFVILTLLTNGFAIAAYLALWALLPERGSTTEPVRRLFPFTRSWSTTTLLAVVITGSALLGMAVSGTGPGALVVVALAWLILSFGFSGRAASRRTGAAVAPLPTTAPASEFDRLARVWQQRVANVEHGLPVDWVPSEPLDDPDPFGLYTPGPRQPAGRPSASRRRGRRTWLGVLVGLGVVWTVLAVVVALGRDVPPLAWAAATLGVLGLSLLSVARPARAAYGRPFGLVAATLLAGVVTVSLMVPAPTPASLTSEVTPDVQVTDHLLPPGDRTVDLSTVAVDQDTTTTVRVDAGRLIVLLPDTGNVEVRASVDAGELDLPDRTDDGFDLAATWRRVEDPDRPTLVVEASVGLGELEVRP